MAKTKRNVFLAADVYIRAPTALSTEDCRPDVLGRARHIRVGGAFNCLARFANDLMHEIKFAIERRAAQSNGART